MKISSVTKWTKEEDEKVQRFETARGKNLWLLENSKIGFFDIETTNLDASIGAILAACVKERGGKTHDFLISKKVDDSNLVKKIKEEVEKYDYIVTWYGTGFDVPFINTRLLLANSEPIAMLRHIDLYYHARSKLKLHSNRLAVASEVLLGSDQKTKVMGDIWLKAQSGDREALGYVLDHCQKDVWVLEQVFERMKGFVNFSATRWRRFGASY